MIHKAFTSATVSLGWRVVAAIRSPDSGLAALRSAAVAAVDDSRLIAIPLDLWRRILATAVVGPVRLTNVRAACGYAGEVAPFGLGVTVW